MRLIVNVALIYEQMREGVGCASNKRKKIVFCLAIVTWALTKRALAGDGVGSIIPLLPSTSVAREAHFSSSSSKSGRSPSKLFGPSYRVKSRCCVLIPGRNARAIRTHLTSCVGCARPNFASAALTN